MSPAPPEEIVEAWDLADGVSAMLTKLIRGAEATPEMGSMARRPWAVLCEPWAVFRVSCSVTVFRDPWP